MTHSQRVQDLLSQGRYADACDRQRTFAREVLPDEMPEDGDELLCEPFDFIELLRAKKMLTEYAEARI